MIQKRIISRNPFLLALSTSTLLGSLLLGCGSLWPDERGDFINEAARTAEEDVEAGTDDEDLVTAPHIAEDSYKPKVKKKLKRKKNPSQNSTVQKPQVF